MSRKVLVEEALTYSVIGFFFKVYNGLGFGFLEHLYVMALERELLTRGHRVAREMGVRVFYEGTELGIQRLDMVVDDKLVVETKSTFDLHKAAQRQVLNYLKATNLEVGLLLHFGPQPKYYRLYSPNREALQRDQACPMHPDEPSSVGLEYGASRSTAPQSKVHPDDADSTDHIG
jgi:GxxExxY protein